LTAEGVLCASLLCSLTSPSIFRLYSKSTPGSPVKTVRLPLLSSFFFSLPKVRLPRDSRRPERFDFEVEAIRPPLSPSSSDFSPFYPQNHFTKLARVPHVPFLVEQPTLKDGRFGAFNPFELRRFVILFLFGKSRRNIKTRSFLSLNQYCRRVTIGGHYASWFFCIGLSGTRIDPSTPKRDTSNRI